MHFFLILTSKRFAGSIPRFCKHSFFEIGDEIFSVAILSLPLIKVERLSVAGEIMCTEYW